MDVIESATSPWGQNVPIHIAWFLIWVAAIVALIWLISLFAGGLGGAGARRW